MKIETIVDYLLGKIATGEYSTGDKIPSEYELADQFGVNKKTANKAVSELVARNILERKAGRGGTVVRGAATRCKGTFAVFLSGTVSYYSNLLLGIQAGAFQRGYNTLFFKPNNPHDFQEAARRLAELRPDGIIITHLPDLLPDLGIPVLWVNDKPNSTQPFNYLHHDNTEGGRLIARHLLELGHRKIGYILQNRNEPSILARYRGFCETLAKKKLAPVFDEEFTGYSLRMDHLCERLLKLAPDVSAIACDSDQIAMRLILALRKRGVCVPEDISVTGFSYLPEYQDLIGITTIDEHPGRIGAYAAELLSDIIEKRIQGPVNETFGVEFRVGETTSPAASTSP